ncbi:hypothetical protein RvY_14939-2 [Ramazzottius varieornatus]|uniref:Uncharacterized protein n=1 Tax=Ramazzottius varieornatus TaxID=947166 RepID=A0A1D1VWQ0_RAMVA|nr:hypothetical protein RvY_14939-2 [Ramazzottius varieornatus]
MAKSTWISIFLQQLLTLISIMILSVIQEISALRCYECNPASAFSISGSYSSSSSFASSNNNNGVYSSSTSDCYNADSRQIKDCPWDSQSCYTVVLPGPQSSSGVYNTQQQQGQFGVSGSIPYGNPYMANTGLQVQRGCGRYPGVYSVGDEDCQIVTLPGTSTRATVCNCRSDSCNSRRPDQVINPLTGQNNAIGSNTGTGFYPSSGVGNTYSNYNQQQQPGYLPNQYGTNSPNNLYGQPGYNQYNPNAVYGQNTYQSGYYGSGQQYPNTAYGPQSNPGTYGSNYPQSQYGIQSNQYGGVVGTVGTPYGTQYGYDGRYGAASANWLSPWTLSFSLVMLYFFAKL